MAPKCPRAHLLSTTQVESFLPATPPGTTGAQIVEAKVSRGRAYSDREAPAKSLRPQKTYRGTTAKGLHMLDNQALWTKG